MPCFFQRISLLVFLLTSVGCAETAPKFTPVHQRQAFSGVPRPYVTRWEPVPPGIVLTRNFMVPKSPAAEGYRLFHPAYRIGSKAFGRQPPPWWLAMVNLPPGDPWHAKEFPLAFAGEFKSEKGETELLVVQTSHGFTGEGFFSPGPEIYLVAHWFALKGGTAKHLRQEKFSLGSMQFYRLLAGQKDGRKIVFETEGGKEFDTRKITGKRSFILKVAPDHSLRLTKGDLVSP